MMGWGWRQRQQGQNQGQPRLSARQGWSAPRINYFDPNNYDDANQTTVSDIIQEAATIAAEEQGRFPSASDVLRQALIAGGVPDPTGSYSNQAHHIVESSNEEGKAILEEYEINLNSAVNGVFLPTENPDGSDDLTTHLGSHIKEYRNCVNAALKIARDSARKAGSDEAEALINRLNGIRWVLLTRVVPLNGRVDPDYNPDTDGPMSIEVIFREARLFDPVR